MAFSCATTRVAPLPDELRARLVSCWDYMNPMQGDPPIDLASYERAMDLCSADLAAIRKYDDGLRGRGR